MVCYSETLEEDALENSPASLFTLALLPLFRCPPVARPIPPSWPTVYTCVAKFCTKVVPSQSMYLPSAAIHTRVSARVSYMLDSHTRHSSTLCNFHTFLTTSTLIPSLHLHMHSPHAQLLHFLTLTYAHSRSLTLTHALAHLYLHPPETELTGVREALPPHRTALTRCPLPLRCPLSCPVSCPPRRLPSASLTLVLRCNSPPLLKAAERKRSTRNPCPTFLPKTAAADNLAQVAFPFSI